MAKLTDTLNKLKISGLPVTEYKEVRNLREAFAVGDRIGYPLVLKINSDEHKTEKNAVITNIANALHLKNVWEDITSRINDRNFVVQKQIDGIEIIIGAKKEKNFGKLVMVGSGGILSEIFEDVQFRTAPLTVKEAKKMLKDTKASKLLKGYRGKKANEKKLINLLVDFSKFVTKIDFNEIDLNPVIINENGAFIVDGRIS